MDPQHLGGAEWLAISDIEQRGAEEGQYKGDQQHQHEADVLGQVVVDLAALLDREHDRGEVVVGQDHPARVLGDLGAAAHGDADVGGLDGRGVVDPVAGHGHHGALLLERVGQQHLVLGGHPADHADLVDAVEPFGLRQGGEVRAQDGLTVDAELAGDRGAGGDVVPGDHPDPDVRGLGSFHRRLGLLPGRVDHADQAGHLQAGDVAEQVTTGVELGRVEIADRGGHHPPALALHPLHVLRVRLCQGLIPGKARRPGQRRSGPVHHRGRGALDEAADHRPPRGVGGRAERGHQLVGGVERQGGQPGEPLPGALDVQAGLVAKQQQRALGRIPDHLAVHQLRVAGHEVGQDRVLDAGRGTRRMMDLALQAVSGAGDGVPVRRAHHLHGGHLVHGQRAGLVGVDR